MVSAGVLRGHAAHFLVFGVPVAALVCAVGWQEVRGRAGTRSRPEPHRDRPSDAVWLAGAGLVAAAAFHASVISEHFRESSLFGVFFAVLTVTQLGLAVALTRRPDRRTVQYVAIGSACVVVLWLVSRTTGLPVGPEPWRPESFGGLDIAASCAELITTLGCVAHLWTVGSRHRPFVPRSPGLTR